MSDAVGMHIEKNTIQEIVITPEHAKRSESDAFKGAKSRLAEDGHYSCWICGSTRSLQVHHFAAEWSLESVVDFKKLKKFCEEWDVYGYGKLLRNKPIETVDDIRNLMVLCQEHHQGKTEEGIAHGIHNLTFPIFIIQKLAKDGLNPVPQEGETIEEVEKRIEEC